MSRREWAAELSSVRSDLHRLVERPGALRDWDAVRGDGVTDRERWARLRARLDELMGAVVEGD